MLHQFFVGIAAYQWQSVEECTEFHKTKSAFARFPPEAMTDFGTYGLTQYDDSYQLAFPREWKAHIYVCGR